MDKKFIPWFYLFILPVIVINIVLIPVSIYFSIGLHEEVCPDVSFIVAILIPIGFWILFDFIVYRKQKKMLFPSKETREKNIERFKSEIDCLEDDEKILFLEPFVWVSFTIAISKNLNNHALCVTNKRIMISFNKFNKLTFKPKINIYYYEVETKSGWFRNRKILDDADSYIKGLSSRFSFLGGGFHQN